MFDPAYYIGNKTGVGRKFKKATGIDQFAEDFKEGVGITDRESGRLAREQRAANQRQYGEVQGVNQRATEADQAYQERMRQAGQDFRTSRDPFVDNYVSQQTELKNQAQNQAQDARNTYTNTIQPQMKDLMETERQNAQGAMTLAEASNPNNAVATNVRNMYNQQAQGYGRQGLANAGVMANLGAQAFANQAGGMPMTGSQMQMLAAQSQSQGADAYARTQRHMESLRQQGIERGFSETDKAYGRGLEARDRWRRGVGDIEGAEDRFHQGQQGFRGEIGDRSADIMGTEVGRVSQDYGLETGQAGLEQNMAERQMGRDMGEIGMRYGNEAASRTAQMQQSAARQRAKNQILTGGLQVAGTVAGGIYGGPVGAKAGQQTGQMIGGSMAAPPPPQQSYMPPPGYGTDPDLRRQYGRAPGGGYYA